MGRAVRSTPARFTPFSLTPQRSADAFLTDPRCACRYCDNADMGPEERGNALAEPRVIEYCVHGHFYRSPTDQKGVHGAWWIPLRRLMKRAGREKVEPKITEFEDDMRQRSRQQMDDFEASDSDDEVAAAGGV